MADEKEGVKQASSEKDKPEVEKAVNIEKVKKLSRKQKGHPHKQRMMKILFVLGFLIVVFFILSNTSVLKNFPENQTLMNPFENASKEQPVANSTQVQEKAMSEFSNANFGIMFSYPKGFRMESYIGKDVSLYPPKIEGSGENAPIIITESKVAAGMTAERYMKGTMIPLGFYGYKAQKVTLADNTEAQLLETEVTRANNPKGAYLLVWVNKDRGYYMYYLAPLAEYKTYLMQVENIGSTIKLFSG